ncbi:RNA-directed RNA polymerase [ssRNA phage Esthiorhiza.3_7]|uniref:RNA-directed RNA polymerase n=2 Tax=Leviviricetes TaxID=2842243 RepID=A0A8S5L1J9_9VIRU|nr:RNA-directed RNA polymerase [ssRNA phage Esthiorhiza.3_7]QDH87702.1 MAG: RNA-dependent RNA polymerase [Leviviridae sp.]DAD51480.1 TPA_asm: RNA-directed RNA polymerase [ssRNA phage Esthiorhiza.3_7]
MKSLIDLWCNSAEELAEWCHTCTTLDIKTVKRRIKHEGFSFLTITLPDFGKEFEKALDQGYVDLRDFRSFKFTRKGPNPYMVPVFLQGFMRQVFDEVSGQLLPQADIDCIFAIRQLTNLFAKIELPCSNSRVVRAMQAYVDCEKELEAWESTVPQELLQSFHRTSRLLFADVCNSVDSDVYTGAIQPAHGPGSTADGLVGNNKFRMPQWTQRLESIFPYGEFCLPSWRYWYLQDQIEFLEPGDEMPVKVISVPKTLKSPRVIAMEPSYMQYMQQGILRRLVLELEDPEELCSNFLGFTDQVPNRDLAREGSLTGQLATLDLKEASDRVPYLLVKLILENSPWLAAAVDATRSSRAEISELGLCIPNLRKFASMGSALCFPFEAMVFLIIVLMGVSNARGRPLTRSFLNELRGKVRVYGDDIIVPTDCVLSVIDHLEAFGFKVNDRKSFWNGKFRESCGGDFFSGEDVTPVRLKKEFPQSRKDGTKVKALVEFRNRLYLRGMWKTASWLDEQISDLLKGHYPIVEPTSPAIGRRSFLPYVTERMDDEKQAPRVRAYTLRPVIKGPRIDDVPALLKCLASPVIQEDPQHLERSGRPVVVGTKLRWVAPF